MDLFKKDYIIGLDIGTFSVKIAQFAKRPDGLHLVRSDLKEIKNENEIIAALKEMFRGVDLKKSKVIASINCPKTTTKKITSPYMPKAELERGIKLEAKSYFHFPIDDSSLDFEILGDIVEKGIRKYEVLVSVSPKAIVDKYLSLLRKLGIKPASFVTGSYAMQKLIEAVDTKEEKTACCLDIGKIFSELSIFRGRILVFSRKIPITGDDITKAMTGVLVSDRGKTELSIDEAEKIKKEIGIPSGSDSKIIDDKISTTQILSMIRSSLEQLAVEIERCFDYYREESGSGKIDSLTLYGGGAALNGLIKFLSDSLGIEVTLGDAFQGLNMDSKAAIDRTNHSYRMEFAIGAGLSEAKGLNLLPPEIKEEMKRMVKRSTAEVFVTSFLLISLLFYIGLRIQSGNLDTKVSVAKKELVSLNPQFKKAEAQYLANMVLVDEPYWDEIFKELSHVTPREIYLTRIKFSDGIIVINGIILSQNGEEHLSGFILSLEEGIFKNVKLVRSKDLKDKIGNEFEIKCSVD